MSISSKNNCPSGISIVLPSDFAKVVLPHPTGPTIAINSPGKILKLNSFFVVIIEDVDKIKMN